ncbi:MAG: fibrobacter succinogenes major paralogous domain-containing protein, partial [Tannerellaceae bacterium]|nr:fibrobacter succinogenes major paralogous domain-containing protein [Tannerellaceae bacterium]
PDGWKVPTWTETKSLTDDYGNAVYVNSTTDKRIRFNGDNQGEYLYIVPRGFYSTKTFGSANASLWASTAYSTDAELILLMVGSKAGYVGGVSRTWALPVRCIQQ